jgi:hypothetical protein
VIADVMQRRVVVEADDARWISVTAEHESAAMGKQGGEKYLH